MGRHGMRWEELRWDELRWSACVKCGVWGVKSAMWSVRKVFALYRGHAQVTLLDSNTATASHKARTHRPGWRTAHASSIDEKGLIYIYIFKATSAPPRAGTTGIDTVCIYVYIETMHLDNPNLVHFSFANMGMCTFINIQKKYVIDRNLKNSSTIWNILL